MCACMRVCVRACVCMCVCACVRQPSVQRLLHPNQEITAWAEGVNEYRELKTMNKRRKRIRDEKRQMEDRIDVLTE